MGALLLAVTFHFTVLRRTASRAEVGRLRGAIVGTVSLCLWFAVGTAGRAIGFY